METWVRGRTFRNLSRLALPAMVEKGFYATCTCFGIRQNELIPTAGFGQMKGKVGSSLDDVTGRVLPEQFPKEIGEMLTFQPCRQSSANANVAASRTVEHLWRVIAESLDAFTPTECANYFAAAGYDAF